MRIIWSLIWCFHSIFSHVLLLSFQHWKWCGKRDVLKTLLSCNLFRNLRSLESINKKWQMNRFRTYAWNWTEDCFELKLESESLMRCFPPEWMEICLRGCPSRMNKQMMLLLLTIEEHLDTHANVDVVKLLAQNMKRESSISVVLDSLSSFVKWSWPRADEPAGFSWVKQSCDPHYNISRCSDAKQSIDGSQFL